MDVMYSGQSRDASVSETPRTVNEFLKSWAWKREHRPDRVRFYRPYIYHISDVQSSEQKICSDAHSVVCIEQAPFDAEGFASTVWDSSIVVSKLFEKHQDVVDGFRVRNRRCLDLSAGCGLVGIVMARLGALVTATDLEPNLPLLRRNCIHNTGEETECISSIDVKQHTWGKDTAALGDPFDIVVACDVMYVDQAAKDLVVSLAAVTIPSSIIILAHGRNRQAEGTFLGVAAEHFAVTEVSSNDLDSVFQCSDVTVLLLKKLAL